MNLSESSGLESSAAPLSQSDTEMGLRRVMIWGRRKQRDHAVPSPQPQLSSCNFRRLAQFRFRHFPRADAPETTYVFSTSVNRRIAATRCGLRESESVSFAS